MTEDRPGLRERVVRYRADPHLSREQAADRISAYVYGNILAFAAVVPLTEHTVASGKAVWAVLGVSVSTLLAHVFAELLGAGVLSTPGEGDGTGERVAWTQELRNSTPIVTSATVPCLLLVAGWAGWLPATATVVASEIYLLVRIALVGLVVERLHTERSTARTLLAGLAAAAIAAGIAVLKAVVAH
ncbi:hypothetical protein [Hamadaea tsunoensis]|uniref:hypothetical protein n=1 Tax=Hamadaea tsunoensis TaxID=53368 RepID=UPI0012F8B6C4|nr:hypothetical protein [Hamadaea tsunoensis]